MEGTTIAHIEVTLGVRGGKPRIAGTRICVSDVVIWTEQGQSPEEIVTDFPQLTLADIYAALAYYHDHRQAVDQQIGEAESFAEAMKSQQGSRLPQTPTDKDADGDSLPS